MLKHKLYPRLLLCLIPLALMAATSLVAQELPPQGICLYREPAPPMAALNDGNGIVTFYWTIDYATNFNRNYTLEIVPPPPATSFILYQSPEEPSPIMDSAIWEVPVGTPAGCYSAKLTFYSDWCAGSPNRAEDCASVGFKISAAGVFRLAKFLDWNGNGFWDWDEPSISDWTFYVQKPGSSQVYELITGPDGYTDYVYVPVESTGTNYGVREDLPPGWVKTAPQGCANPFTVSLAPGLNPDVEVGNWQPITISGYKLLDEQAYMWSPWDDLPGYSPGVAGVIVDLYDSYGGWIDQTLTDVNGYYHFPSASFGQQYLQWQPGFVIVEEEMQPNPPYFPYVQGEPAICGSHGMEQWPGMFYPTASFSWMQNPWLDLDTPTDLVMDTSWLQEAYQDYGDNYFYNHQPGRIFGFACPDVLARGLTTIGVDKDGWPWLGGSAEVCQDCGFYCVPAQDEEPTGLRPGTYTLWLPALPAGQQWIIIRYYFDNGVLKSTSTTITDHFFDVDLTSGEDIRVDICIQVDNNKKQCNLPVTFTQCGLRAFSDPNNGLITGGMIYSKFPTAFKEFYFYSYVPVSNKVIVGKGSKTITFDGTTGGLQRLCLFLPQTGVSSKLDRAYVNPWDSTSAGALAGEVLALQINIAYNDHRIMPRTPGYDLEDFIVSAGLLKGKTVGQVLDIANAILGGDPPSSYGLSAHTGYADLTSILYSINNDYEFVDWNTFTDRGYLTPNVPIGMQNKIWHYANRPFSP